MSDSAPSSSVPSSAGTPFVKLKQTKQVSYPSLTSLIKQQGKLIDLVEQIACGLGFKEGKGRKIDAQAPSTNGMWSEEERTRQLKLYRAALNGDWEVAKGIYDKHHEIGVRITMKGYTALHVAASAKRLEFVKELVKIMNADQLADKENTTGSTALFFAAATGEVELATETMNGNPGIANEPDKTGMLPIVRAAALGHRDMVKYLYVKTKDSLNDDARIAILVELIETDLYDVALQLFMDQKQLAITRDKNNETALHVLARKNLTSSNLVDQNKQGIFRKCFNLVSGAKDVENKAALELVKLLWKKVILLSDDEIKKLIDNPSRLIFDAAKQGNVKFLLILISEYPDLIWKVDENGYSIFHIAVLNRLEELFKFTSEVISILDLIVDSKDGKGNNILHLAGKLAPPDRLNVVSGAALQMQRELLWFEKVKNVVPSRLAKAKNKKGLTPRALFSEEHRDLKEKGEKWMKDTASTCMVVATLIATIVFAAAITVPGGNKGDTGLPLFLQNVSFKIFAVSNVISLVAATVSIVNFLSLVAPRFAEEDFLCLLPAKLLVGLGTLSIAIAAMMVVFSATIFIVFKNGSLWIAILAIVLSSVPVFLFVYQHLRLFFVVLRSILPPHYLIPKCETGLFYKEGETTTKQKKKTKQFNGNLTIQCACSTNV